MNIVFTISEVHESSGKTSVVNQVCELLDGLDLAIPYTTRTPRMADNRDRDFVFTSREAFELMIARGEFLEHVSVWGNYYGTPCHSLQQAKDNGRDLLVKVDESGVAQIKQKIPEAVSILVTTGQLGQDKDTVGSTNVQLLHSRLQEESSKRQMLNPDKYDHIIVNDRLEDSANKVIEIIRAERLRRS
jgi:guanylate kinase